MTASTSVLQWHVLYLAHAHAKLVWRWVGVVVVTGMIGILPYMYTHHGSQKCEYESSAVLS